jgi:hypothetical protein
VRWVQLNNGLAEAHGFRNRGEKDVGIQFMHKSKSARAAGLALYSAACLAAGPVLAAPAEKQVATPEQGSYGRYAQLPMLFERNDGQTNGEVRFLARGIGYSLFLSPAEAVFALQPPSQRGDTGGRVPAAGPRSPAAVLRMSMHGGNPAPRLEAQGLQASRSHYFRGNDPAQWRTDVEQFAKVFYRDVYPGIDLVYYGNQQQLEYDFVIEPGRDPQQIALNFDGVQSLRVNEAGELVLRTPLGEVVQYKPVVYQQVGAMRRPVEGQYRVLGERRVGFDVGSYDRSLTLVIDPVLAYNTYIGGSGDEHISAIAVDAAGNTYVTGSTASMDFPTSGTFMADGAVEDVFVTKFNAHGNAVLYSTYLGGAGGEYGLGIGVEANGNVYVSGWTTSVDFPTSQPIQPRIGGGKDGFVAQLDASGSGLVFSTYLGGALDDSVHGLALDESGAVYVAGSTQSSDFPIVNPFQLFPGGAGDGFVTRLHSTGALDYSSYLGGSNGDSVYGIAVDSTGAAYVTGMTTSLDFPVVDPIQSGKSGDVDAFLTRVDPSGGSLAYSTYYGGSGDDYSQDVALDEVGYVYFGGFTFPPDTGAPNDFPVHAAHQLAPGGGMDGFLVGFDVSSWEPWASVPKLVFSTYYGGSGADQIRELAAYEFGVYTVGYTRSVDLPLLRPTQNANGGDVDVLIGNFVLTGEMYWSTYFGGAGADYGFAAAALGHRNLYLGGGTTDTAQPAKGRYSAGTGGANDAFLVRFGKLGYSRQDFNGDGVADVLWRNSATGANTIWQSANPATPQAMASVPSQDWQIVGVGQFDDDFRADVVWRNKRTGAATIWLSADHMTQKAMTTVASQDWQVAGVGDFDRDFDPDDILWRNRRTGANTIWLSADHMTQKAVIAVANPDWNIVGVGDFNDDDTSDILWRNRATGANAIWLSGNSATQQPIAAVPNQDWQVAGVADFLADSEADILWHNHRTGQNVIWPNGNAASGVSLSATDRAWTIAAVDDYNADGRADILWRNSADGRHSIWGSGTPTLPQAMIPVANQSWQIVK